MRKLWRPMAACLISATLITAPEAGAWAAAFKTAAEVKAVGTSGTPQLPISAGPQASGVAISLTPATLLAPANPAALQAPQVAPGLAPAAPLAPGQPLAAPAATIAPTLQPAAPVATTLQPLSPKTAATSTTAPRTPAAGKAKNLSKTGSLATLEATAKSSTLSPTEPATSEEGAASRAAQSFEGSAAKPDSSVAVPAKTGRVRTFLKASTAKARGFGRDAVGMYRGDPELEPLLDNGVKPGMRRTQLLLVGDAVFSIGMSFVIGPLLDTAALAAKVGFVAAMPHLAVLSGLLFAGFLAYTAVERGHAYLSRATALRAVREYRAALHRSLMRQEMDFHLEQGSGKLAGRLLNDTSYLSNKNIDTRLSLTHYALHLVFGTTMMLVTSPALSLAVLPAIPILVWLSNRFGGKIKAVSEKISDRKSDLMKQSQESLQSAETVKSFGAEAQEAERYNRKADEAADLAVQEAKLGADYSFFAGGLTEFFTKDLVLIIGGAALALSLGITFGGVTQFMLFAGSAKYAFMGLSRLYLSYKRNEGVSQTVRELIARQPGIADPAGAKALPAGPGRIEFSDVTFAYPKRQAEPVLRSLSFTAEPGKTVAFVGETGSGKSTITRLLLRLWEPDAGRITVDGQDIRRVLRQSLLGRMAVVPQETRLFNGTLRENMLFGSEDATETQLQEAVLRADARFVNDLSRFPQGLDTPVAEGGNRLSGGERQRVSIVRALLRQPSILILDEATSALDSQTEREVQRSIEALHSGQGRAGPTTLVIAHRLSTIRRADRINFLEHGRIAESGTHDELLKLGGRYARLWQEGGYDTPGALAPEEAPVLAAETAQAAAAGQAAQAAAASQGWRAGLSRFMAGVRAGFSSVADFVRGDASVKPFVSSRAFYAVVGLLFGNAVLGLAGSHLLGLFLDHAMAAAAAPALVPGLWPIALGALALLAASIVLTRHTARVSGALNANALAGVRKALMARLQSKDMRFLGANDSGALASRLNEDTEALVRKNVDVRTPLLGYLVSLVAGTALLLSVNPIAGAVVFVMLPVLGVINGYFGQKRERLYSTFSQRRAELGRFGKESLEQVQTIKTFGREDEESAQYRQRAQALVDVGEADARAGATAHMLSSSLTDFFTKQIIYLLGAWAVAMSLGLSVGAIVAMIFYAGFVKEAFSGFSSAWLDYKNARGETEVVRGWLSEALSAHGTKRLPPGGGEVVFDKVSFRYSEDGQGGVADVSLRIKPGETVAFVGESGSGKSTLLKLLHNLWSPQQGKVLVDGVPVAEADPKDLTMAVAKVPQETRLFDDSLRYNMSYGSSQATEAELAAAITAARADFVNDREQFPQGLDTRVGEGGATLSGGQRQRVAIVRALLKRPRILILDEATAALDKKTEREIQETLDHLSTASGAKPTTLVIAHNLTTVAHADRIVVMDHGRIAEMGTHAELLARGGIYARLWRLQSQD